MTHNIIGAARDRSSGVRRGRTERFCARDAWSAYRAGRLTRALIFLG